MAATKGGEEKKEKRKKDLEVVVSCVAARVVGDAAGVQVSRHVRLLHGEDLLDEATQFSRGWGQSEGPIRRRVQSYGEQLGSGAWQWERDREQFGEQFGARASRRSGSSTPVQLPAEAVQPGAQAARTEGPRLPGTLTPVLREEPETRHSRHPR